MNRQMNSSAVGGNSLNFNDFRMYCSCRLTHLAFTKSGNYWLFRKMVFAT